MKLVVPDQEFLDLLGDLEVEGDPETRPKTALRMLEQAFQNVPGARSNPKIALRHTVGPTNACINFHCNGGYATITTQIALNEPSDCEGGRLVYFVNDEVPWFTPTPSFACRHEPSRRDTSKYVCRRLFEWTR